MTAATLSYPFVSDTIVTNEDGLFDFEGYLFFDTTTFFFQARRFDTKKNKVTNSKNLTIFIDDVEKPAVSEKKNFIAPMSQDEINRIREAKQKANKIDSAFDMANRTIILEGITVEDSKENEEHSWALHSMADRSVKVSGSIGTGNMYDYIMLKPEFRRVTRYLPSFGASLDSAQSFGASTSVNGVAFILDGFPIDFSQLSTIMQSEIEKVDMLGPAQAGVYGPDAYNGAFILFSSPLTSVDNVIKGISSISHPGLYLHKEFYSPNYSESQKEHAKKDVRSTLYWQPNFLSENDSTYSFFANDVPGIYTIDLQGITDDGIPFVYKDSIEVY